MQVARNFFLTREDHLPQIYEILLAFKIEQNLSKDQILEVLHQPDLPRAPRLWLRGGFARPIFGKPLVTCRLPSAMPGRSAQGAVGLQPDGQPEARRAAPAIRAARMTNSASSPPPEQQQAIDAPLKVATPPPQLGFGGSADYVAEMARQIASSHTARPTPAG